VFRSGSLGGNFARNCRLSVIVFPHNSRRGRHLFADHDNPHVDHTEQDATMIVTEYDMLAVEESNSKPPSESAGNSLGLLSAVKKEIPPSVIPYR
jgi:hypothetical protein